MSRPAAPATNSRRVTLSRVTLSGITRGVVALLCACALWLVVSAKEPKARVSDVRPRLLTVPLGR
ncbi:MAG TPA: hypothetical protein VE869_04285 [Gemmatimonas sp.]|nr:hypothetical protein [Gemmatimonas sp.]